MSSTSKSTASINRPTTTLSDSQSNPSDSLKVTKSSSVGDISLDSQTDSQAALHAETYQEGYSESYFDTLYSDNSDPWQYQTRWYEKRKRDMCLAVLPQANYTNAIELGCGNGVFSELLAHRCQALLSIDGNNKAVQLANQRLAGMSHVKVIQGIIPNALSTLEGALLEAYPSSDLPASPPYSIKTTAPSFDLIVISEILYYLSASDIDKVIAWIGQNLTKGGTLLCCHWRYAIDGFTMTGETVHQRLYEAFGLVARTDNANNNGSPQLTANHTTAFNHQSQTVDSDFLLDVWQNSSKSVAMQESLV